jgi:hypothetical protein
MTRIYEIGSVPGKGGLWVGMVLRSPDMRLSRVLSLSGSSVYVQEGVNQNKYLVKVVEKWPLAKRFEEEIP